MLLKKSFTRIVAFGFLGLLAAQAHSAPLVFQFRTSDGTTVFSDAPSGNNSLTRTAYKSSYKNQSKNKKTVNPCSGLTAADLRRRATQFQPAISKAATEQKLDELFIQAVAQVESCFDPKAVSRAGAQGLMQLMPNTAKELGVANSFDSTQNVQGGARYLAQLLSRFEQNHQLALAAYNAGPGAVEKHDGIPPYPETQKYVQRVMNVYQQLSKHKISNAQSAGQES